MRAVKTTALILFMTLISVLIMSPPPALAQEGDEFDVLEEPFRTNPSQELDPEDVELDTSRVSISEETQADIPIDQQQEINDKTEQSLTTDKSDPAFEIMEEPNKAQLPPTVEKTHEGNGEDDGLVEIRSNAAIFLPYKQRQDRWGWTFSLGAEFVDFPSLISQFDDNSFQAVFGSSGQTMPVLELGPKFNFSWGSLGLQLGYSLLDITNESLGAKNALRIQRLSSTATFYLDALFSEGQFIPYGSFGVWQSEYSEETSAAPGDIREYSTEPGYHARFGALIGLDWLDLSAMYRSRRETGITAMFINVYGSTSYMSESSPDPDLENELDIGASLQFEF